MALLINENIVLSDVGITPHTVFLNPPSYDVISAIILERNKQ